MNGFRTLKKFLVFLPLLLTCLFTAQSIDSRCQQGGDALSFDGIDQYVNLGKDNVFNFGTSSFTIELWFRTSATEKLQVLFGKDGYCHYNGYYLRIEDGSVYAPNTNKLRCVVSAIDFTECGNTSKAVDIAGSTVVTDGLWHHAALVVDRSYGLEISLWLDGLYEAGGSNYAVNASDIISNGECLGLGSINYYADEPDEPCYNGGLGCWSGFFQGDLDEMRVWNTVRTDAQIKTNMHREISAQTGLVAYYNMSDGSGTTLSDNSGNGNNGSMVNSPSWKTSGCFAGPRQALEFDGTNDYVQIPWKNALDMGSALTLEAWVKPFSSEPWMTLLMKGNYGYGLALSGSGNSSCLETQQSGKIIYWDQVHCYATIRSSVTYCSGTWQHIAVTVEDIGSQLRIFFFLNGKSDGPYYSNYAPISNGGDSSSIRIGVQGEGNPFMGQMDELRIWNVVRSPAQIRENMMRTLDGNESGLAAYYRFDQKDGSTLYDITQNGCNGVLTNMNSAASWATSSAFNTWIGRESSLWGTAANWGSSSVPGSTDNVGLYKWNALCTEIAISGEPTVNHLMIGSGSSPGLNSNLSVNGNLLLERDLDLNGKVVTLGPSGMLDEGSHRLFGTSGTITTIRTLDNITGMNVGGLGATLTTSQNMGSTVITRGHAVQAQNGGPSIKRYFDITPANNTNLNATLVFKYNDNELNNLTEADLKLFKSTNAGSTWTNMAGTLNTTSNTLTVAGLDGFSRWTAGDAAMDCVNPASGGEIEAGQTICTGTVPSAFTSKSAPSGYNGTPEYKWQSSTTNATEGFSDISSSNSATYAPGALTTTTWYRRLARVNCKSDWTGATASNTLEITVNQPSFVGTTRYVSDLQATGENIKWYTTSTGGTALPANTVIASGHYYASQTVNGVESLTRLDVVVTVENTPCKPAGSSTQTFASGATVASLAATGTNIRWYTAASGGTALPASTLLVNGTHYFATQTVSCTESASRLEVTVTVTE